jgi:hypothetical protein
MSKKRRLKSQLDQTGGDYGTGTGFGGGKARPGTGSGNKQPLVDQAREAHQQFGKRQSGKRH